MNGKDMAKTFKISNGFITIVSVDFICPKCEYPYSEKDYYPQLYKSKNGLIHKKCKGCKTKLGITTDIIGDVRVWLKDDEK